MYGYILHAGGIILQWGGTGGNFFYALLGMQKRRAVHKRIGVALAVVGDPLARAEAFLQGLDDVGRKPLMQQSRLQAELGVFLAQDAPRSRGILHHGQRGAGLGCADDHFLIQEGKIASLEVDVLAAADHVRADEGIPHQALRLP